MSSVLLAFSSRSRFTTRDVRPNPDTPGGGEPVPLSSLPEGARATIVEVSAHDAGREDRLLALGVTHGASVVVLQTFPGVVFRCDQTELAVEHNVAGTILVRVQEMPS